MKRLLLVLVVTACRPSFDFDLDLDPGPVVGDQGVATFAFVDGCPGADALFGCPKSLPGFAVGSHARFVAGSLTGDADDEQQIADAKVTSSDSKIVVATRDADGLVSVRPVGIGDATVQLEDDGDVVDSFQFHVQQIAFLRVPGTTTPTMLAGPHFAAVVDAQAADGEPLYAHEAITARTSGGLILEHTASGYFTSSEQVVVRSDAPGEGRVEFTAGDAWTEGHFHIVSRDQITTVNVGEIFPEAGATKVRLEASTKVGEEYVQGGPACDWSIVSGGGPGAALSSTVDDDLDNTLFVFYNAAIVYGEGDMTVECRANDHVVGQHTLHLGP